MDQDEMLVDKGRDYVKMLISDLSKSSHVMSKYTSIATIKANCEEDQVISLMKFAEKTNR